MSFRNTNEDVRAQNQTVKEGQQACEASCQVSIIILTLFLIGLLSPLFLNILDEINE